MTDPLNSFAMLLLCPICAEEFMPRLALCPTCGCNLIPSSFAPVEIEEESTDSIEFVELCRPRAYPLAMLIRQMLEQNGVTVMIQGGHSLSMLPHLAFGGELRVFVDRRQYDFALALYRAYFENEGEEYTPEE